MERLPEILLNKSVNYHCRKGITQTRTCNCDYCNYKARATYDMACRTKHWERNYKRFIIRQQLEELKYFT